MNNRREGMLDRVNKNHKLANIIQNGQIIPAVLDNVSTNSTSYTTVGLIILNMEALKIAAINEARFVARSGSLGADGLDVRLYNIDGAVSLGTINFSGAENQTIKTNNILNNIESLTGRFMVAVQIRKAGPIGPATLRAATIEFFGELSGTGIGG